MNSSTCRLIRRALLLLAAGLSLTARADRFVSQATGSDSNGGTAWSDAWASVAAAVTRTPAGETIRVSNGTYAVAAAISITNSITLASVNGADVTSITRTSGNIRVIHLLSPGAVLDGFTVSNGNWALSNQRGGGVYMTNGLVRNCVLRDNTSLDGGGALHMTGGLVSNCVIANNRAIRFQGGGVYMEGGTLTQCTVASNTVDYHGAGGIFMVTRAGTVDRCVIRANTAYGDGGGVSISAGGSVLRSSLVDGNTAGNGAGPGLGETAAGGGVHMSANGRVQNCTITGNRAGTAGDGVHLSSGAVTNSIVYFNGRHAYARDGRNISTAGVASVSYSCMSPLVGGTGNTAREPRFIDRRSGDYRLAAGSPGLDGGIATADLGPDLDGSPRNRDGDGDGSPAPDMGAYEAEDGTGGVFRCGFVAATNEALGAIEVVFTAHAAGTNRAVTSYAWDFGNGAGGEAGGVVTQAYPGPGFFTVSLSVSNSSGEAALFTVPDFVKVASPTTHVGAGGASAIPYASWSTAASNLQDAVDAAWAPGGVVWAAGGAYSVSAQLAMAKAVTLRSVADAASTRIVRSAGIQRVLYLNEGAVVDGFTLASGNAGRAGIGGAVLIDNGSLLNCWVTNSSAEYGGGIFMLAGRVSNCVVRRNFANQANRAGSASGGGNGIHMSGGLVVDSAITTNGAAGTCYSGGGILMTGGVVSNCTVSSNVVNGLPGGNGGGGIRMSGGAVVNCRITANWTTRATPGCFGGGADISGPSIMRNCLVAGNATFQYGAGVYLAGGRIENCTIVTNRGDGSAAAVPGVWLAAGGVTNTIVSGNSGGATQTFGTASAYGYCCAPGLPHGANGNITNTPLFENHAEGDYALATRSPCIDRGTNLPWINANSADLAGHPRLINGTVDIGAFEYVWPPARGATLIVR